TSAIAASAAARSACRPTGACVASSCASAAAVAASSAAAVLCGVLLRCALLLPGVGELGAGLGQGRLGCVGAPGGGGVPRLLVGELRACGLQVLQQSAVSWWAVSSCAVARGLRLVACLLGLVGRVGDRAVQEFGERAGAFLERGEQLGEMRGLAAQRSGGRELGGLGRAPGLVVRGGARGRCSTRRDC
ncbi:hypothetical protein, partial [Actinomadura sp. NPDC049753]|uniref:hypothetical protein n=1 Tax=Actinomadura sp. NPDC049753 TaxID=3154739 RepID=UPI003413A938